MINLGYGVQAPQNLQGFNGQSVQYGTPQWNAYDAIMNQYYTAMNGAQNTQVQSQPVGGHPSFLGPPVTPDMLPGWGRGNATGLFHNPHRFLLDQLPTDQNQSQAPINYRQAMLT